MKAFNSLLGKTGIMASLYAFLIIILLAYTCCNAEIALKDSQSTLEKQIASLLKERLKITTTFKNIDANDLIVECIFAPEPVKEMPGIIAFIDTRILSRNKKKMPASQVVGFASIADIHIIDDKMRILTWINEWNSRLLPVRIYLKDKSLVASSNLLIEEKAPLSNEQVIRGFVNVVQVWQSIIKDLKKEGLLK